MKSIYTHEYTNKHGNRFLYYESGLDRWDNAGYMFIRASELGSKDVYPEHFPLRDVDKLHHWFECCKY